MAGLLALTTAPFASAAVDIVAGRTYFSSSPAGGSEVSSPTPGQMVYFAFEWQITGTGSPLQVSYRALLDGATFCSGTTSPASVPGSGTLGCPAWLATAGGHTLRWDLDYTGKVAEGNESNNTRTIAFTVSTPGAAPTLDIVAKRAFISTSNGMPVEVSFPTPGRNFCLMIEFQVAGNGSFGSLPVRWLIDGNSMSTFKDSAVYRAGGGYTSGYCPTFGPGTHKLQIDLNYDHSVSETDVSNNTATTVFTVSSPGGAVNLTQSGTAVTQSSTLPSPGNLTGASAAVDGATDGSFSDGSVSSTNQEPNPWWQVDLGSSKAIGPIVIWNRTDCCASRLKDYWVFVSDSPFLPGDTPATLQNRAATWSSHQTTTPSPTISIPADTQGRYVRVQLSGTDYLSLAEVQVFGQFGGAASYVGTFLRGQPVATYSISVQSARSTRQYR